MSVESRIGQGLRVGERNEVKSKAPEPQAAQIVKPLRIPIVSNGIETWSETIGKNTRLNYLEGASEQIVQDVGEGYFPVIVAGPHDSQANGIELISLADDLTTKSRENLPPEKRINGFLLPLSKALATGQQGLFPKVFYDGTHPALDRHSIRPSLTATINDITQRGVEPNTREFMEDMEDGIKKGYGIMVLPEGSVKAGRKRPDGKRNGMQPFVDISLKACILLAKIHKRQNVVFIPVGIEGGPEIHDPQTKLPHRRALFAGFGFGDPRIGQLNIGRPIKADEPGISEFIKNRDWVSVNDFVEDRVADLVPDLQMRGPYGTNKT